MEGQALISVNVVADSISPEDYRLTTLQCTFHRFILGEFNTHRKFSRNSASSRAIPVEKIINQVVQNPAIPVVFTREQPGMMGGEALTGQELLDAKEDWLQASMCAVGQAQKMMAKGIHKSVVNRILEPYMWHTVLVSSTEWGNFLTQRLHGAQPEMMELASKINSALAESGGTAVGSGGWHLPYIDEEEKKLYSLELQQQISVARVAGASYNRLGEPRPIEKDLNLYDRLFNATPPHWSPFEHVATPSEIVWADGSLGNFDGWNQLRHWM